MKPSLYAPNFVLTKDDIYGCYVFHEIFSGPQRVIRKLDFTNGSNIVIAEDHLLTHINTLAAVDFLNAKLTFTYQATAKLYRFLVSTLFVKHPLFENEPCIPLAVLLHRRHNAETHISFFRTMKELIPLLNTPDINLIVCDEGGVTKAVEHELPEIPTVHVSDATSPRISSAKLDFLLVSVAKSLAFDHIKMIHLVYFLQCHFYNEIVKSLLGSCEGDLLIHSKYDSITCATPSLAERVLPEGALEMLDDALSPSELVAMLSKNPPQVLGSGSDYESCSQNELQLFEGLAHFFIAKDRIEWVKTKGMFLVKGLGGKEYNVRIRSSFLF